MQKEYDYETEEKNVFYRIGEWLLMVLAVIFGSLLVLVLMIGASIFGQKGKD